MVNNIDWDNAVDGRNYRGRSVGNRPYVSIGGGRIYLNTNASELFGLDKQWALIYVDENEKFVALKPLEIKESRAIPVKKSGGKNSNSSSRVINSKTLV